MQHPVVFRVEKHTSMGSIAAEGAHTWRERHTPNADPAKTHLNEDWRPVHGSKDLRLAVKARLATVTEKLATANPVLCLEYLVSAHHTAFADNLDDDGKPTGDVDHNAYFRDALAWLEAKHGADNIVAVNIQNDETAHHLVAFVVPLVDVPASTRKRSVIVGTNPDGTKIRETKVYETPAKTRLSAAHYVGSRELLSQMQTDIADQVGSKHGLRRGIKGSKATHVTIRDYYAAMRQVEDQHAIVTAEAIKPLVTKPGGWLKRDEIEDEEEVAARITRQIQADYASLVALAGTARLHARRVGQLAGNVAGAEAGQELAYRWMRELQDQVEALQEKIRQQESIFDGLRPEQREFVIDLAESIKEGSPAKLEMDRKRAEARQNRERAELQKQPQENRKKVENEPKSDENEPDSGPSM